MQPGSVTVQVSSANSTDRAWFYISNSHSKNPYYIDILLLLLLLRGSSCVGLVCEGGISNGGGVSSTKKLFARNCMRCADLQEKNIDNPTLIGVDGQVLKLFLLGIV